MLRHPDLEEYRGNQIHPQPREYQNLTHSYCFEGYQVPTTKGFMDVTHLISHSNPSFWLLLLNEIEADRFKNFVQDYSV